MRVLILGGTGAMGVPLVEMYSRAGYEVFLTSRSRHQDERNSVVYLQGNALDINWLCSIVKSNVYDAVVDFMVRKLENLQETLNLILPRTAQYIFISSARVYAQTDGLITEDTPRLLDVCTDSEYVKSDEYAIVKAKEENLLLSNELRNWTIIRPTLTYNSYRLQFPLGEKEDWLYRVMHNRSIIVPLDLIKIKTTMMYGNDVASVIFHLTDNKAALGQTVHVAGGQALTWEDVLKVYQNVLQENHIILNTVYVEQALETAKHLGNYYQIKYARGINREFSTQKLESLIGHITFTAMQDGLASCLRLFLQNPKFQMINWRRHAYYDRVAKERTTLAEFDCTKKRIAYVVGRYSGIFLI